MLSPQAGGEGTVIKLGEVVMILDLDRQGLFVSAIALQLGIDRKQAPAGKCLRNGSALPEFGDEAAESSLAADEMVGVQGHKPRRSLN